METIERKPQDILKLARQFMESRILLTAAELNLFTLLDGQPATAGDLAGRLRTDLRGLVILLDALAAMGLLMKGQDAAYRLDPGVAACLSEKSERSVLPMIQHANHLWNNWSNLTARVNGSGPAAASASDVPNDAQMMAFIGAMHVVAEPLAQKIVAVVKPGDAKNLIDIGGASGTYTIAFLKAVPELTATLFDRSTVIPLARERLAEAGMASRVRFVSGDFYQDELPAGHDLALLSAIIHQNGPGQNIDLFQKVLRSMIPGGRLIIRDHIMASDRINPREGALFAVNMLVNTQGGSTYTFDETSAWLEQAGWTGVRLIQTGEHMDGLIEAFRP